MITEKKITSLCFTLKSIGITRPFIQLTMVNTWLNFRRICSYPLVWLISLEASLETKLKEGFFGLKHCRFSKKAKWLIVAVIVAVLLISTFAFLPKPNFNSNNRPPGLIQSAQAINSTVWMEVAANAWAYFQPGTGVDAITGLPYAGGTNFKGFTDWDLGCYIQATIDAQKLGLMGNNSAWSFSERINKVLTFLENRPLNITTSYPFQFYDASTGKEDTSMSREPTADVVDTGRLFVALNNLRNFNSNLTTRIDNIVLYGFYNNRSNYAALLPGIKNDILTSTSIYSYYFDSGFASFWPSLLPNTSIILDNMFSAGNVTTYGNVSLPEASISCDPLLCSVFELNSNSSKLMSLMNQVYLAHEAYYNATGQYVAFDEGNGLNRYIWEWVVLPNGDTWKITGVGSSAYLNVNPVIYTKAAFSFLALYNTAFARSMVVYLEQCLPTPTKGYSDGANNGGTAVSQVGSDTNGLILDADLYAIQNSR